ncbi:ATS1 [Candida theae]|uniref:ATS1 n=1 Tax=Candida theae TaxID=1198502 RepID=A0AAD5FX58_9ASCO|nr:ATS1 [Candida theae]KAI5950214.1 ATS1 [Candida theae]
MYQVLACGSNGSYQLAQNNDEDQRKLNPCLFRHEGEEPTFTNTIEYRPIKVACGGNHTLILLENGVVYSCGDNEFGQTGRPDGILAVPVFTRITPVQNKIIDISCGWDYSFLLTEQNELYACGQGLKGELGLGNDVSVASSPKLVIRFDAKVCKIRTVVNHTIVQTDEGKLYGWGNCRKGQLGTVNKELVKRGAVWQPIELDFGIPHVDTFELGREFTIISTSDTFHIFGKSTIDIYKLRDQVDSGEWMDTMWSSVHFKTHNTIKSFGTNTHGQLYNYDSIGEDFEFVVGSEHGLLKRGSIVYAWGWGEHGNCGEMNRCKSEIRDDSCEMESKDDDITFDYLNVLYDGPDKVVMIAGGCATSWIVIEK